MYRFFPLVLGAIFVGCGPSSESVALVNVDTIEGDRIVGVVHADHGVAILDAAYLASDDAELVGDGWSAPIVDGEAVVESLSVGDSLELISDAQILPLEARPLSILVEDLGEPSSCSSKGPRRGPLGTPGAKDNGDG